MEIQNYTGKRPDASATVQLTTFEFSLQKVGRDNYECADAGEIRRISSMPLSGCGIH